ncbi:MAG TPA: hypothetical protein VGO93_30670 [Candidatus Xenobia bacterium]|jgi:hypothetical protein
MKRPRGAALAITLLSLAMMVVFIAMAFDATEVTNRVAQRYLQATTVEAAARAGLAEALACVQDDRTFKVHLSGQLSASQATYDVSFTPSKAPYSTNNLLGTATVVGYQGRLVPPGCCHLVSVGAYGGVQGTAELVGQQQTGLSGFPEPAGLPGQIQVLSRWGE